MKVSAIHHHESAIGIHMSPPSKPLSYLYPHPTSLGCHRALALGSLHHTADSHWLSILHLVSQLFVRPPQTAILLFCIYFPQGWS